jgi:hypothetical protein
MRYGPWPRSGRLLRHFSFSSSFPRVPIPVEQGHVKGALAHRAQRGLPLTWPRREYIALLEEEEKAPQQPAALLQRCQGPSTAAFTPASGRARRGGSTRPRLVPARHTARQ